MNENDQKILEVSLKLLKMSKNNLLINLRFLDLALSKFKYLPIESTKSIGTNGEYLYYNPKYLLLSYKQEKESVTRLYLHEVMHCVFKHMFVNTLVNQDLWNLACDIAVEAAISELGLNSIQTSDNVNKQSEIDSLKNNMNKLTAEKIYSYLIDDNFNSKKINQLKELFCIDDHTYWYEDLDEDSNGEGNTTVQTSGDGDNDSGESQDTSGNGSSSSDESQDSSSNDSSFSSSSNELEDFWQDVSEKMQTDLETISKSMGDQASNMLQNLREVNRDTYDYSSFLRKFASLNETMKINDDEFDYIFYTYGLKLYDNLPLIEPLEYKEVKQVKEFVIAIDTSGSVMGDVVQKFIEKTYSILKTEESFAKKINLHIIQCDAKIQEDVKITKQEELDNYIKNMTLHGFGGTDFRPVFSYVDTLIKNKEFRNLKGLIYFTDGWGTFPLHKPEYETAFVFLERDDFNGNVPPWAIKLVLRDDEI